MHLWAFSHPSSRVQGLLLLRGSQSYILIRAVSATPLLGKSLPSEKSGAFHLFMANFPAEVLRSHVSFPKSRHSLGSGESDDLRSKQERKATLGRIIKLFSSTFSPALSAVPRTTYAREANQSLPVLCVYLAERGEGFKGTESIGSRRKKALANGKRR